MRAVFNRFRNTSGNEISEDDLPSAVEFLGYVVRPPKEPSKRCLGGFR